MCSKLETGSCINCPAASILSKYVELGLPYQNAIELAQLEGCSDFDPRTTYFVVKNSERVEAVNLNGTIVSPRNK